MPKFDRTGPAGMGPMTGCCLGPCGMGLGWGRGFGRGWSFGLGQGWGKMFSCWNCPLCGYPQPSSKKDQKQFLSDYKKSLEEELKEVEKAVNEVADLK